MGFSLSKSSLKKLEGVHPELVRVVKRAIMLTEVDFGVIEGVRSYARQTELVRTGASQTMESRHLTGHAVDLAAFEGRQVSNKMENYYAIADAMKMASEQMGVAIRWGGAWCVLGGSRTAEQMHQNYLLERKQLGRKPFTDALHFELPKGVFP